MNKKVALIISALAITLSGCEQEPPSQAEEQAFVDDQAGSAVRQQLAEDQKDLDATVKELQTKDPSVKDAYYSYSEKGEKVLHIVREEANGKNSDSVWPLVGGMAMGALTGYAMAQMMNSRGGYNNYQSSNRPMSQAHYDEEERRKRRNTASAGYTNMMMNNSRSAVRASPSYRSNLNSGVSNYRSGSSWSSSSSARSSGPVTSKASGIMSGGSGARAASHGGGFGG